MWYLHVQNVNNNTARSKTSCGLCNAFSYINIVQSATGRRQVGDWSATGRRLVGDWSPIISSNRKQILRQRRSVAGRSPTYRRPVTDRSATGHRLVGESNPFPNMGIFLFHRIATKSVAARSQCGCKVCVSIA